MLQEAGKKLITTLSELEIGSLTLTPTFSGSTLVYTATTENETDQITATPTANYADVTIASEDATIADDGTATWAEGENVVNITVTDGGASKTYKVTVTKS